MGYTKIKWILENGNSKRDNGDSWSFPKLEVTPSHHPFLFGISHQKKHPPMLAWGSRVAHGFVFQVAIIDIDVHHGNGTEAIVPQHRKLEGFSTGGSPPWVGCIWLLLPFFFQWVGYEFE